MKTLSKPSLSLQKLYRKLIPTNIVLFLPFLTSTAFAAGCNIGTFASLPVPDGASNIIVDSAVQVAAAGTLPSYCAIKGRIDRTSTSIINFEVRAPDVWNGKFFMSGNGGTAGSVFPASDIARANQAITRGYVVSSTDTGHLSSNLSWGFNNPLAVENWGSRAIHLTVLLSKDVIMAYYGQQPKYSYMHSCSTGGRQVLMEVQRYPNDFHGVIAGHPAWDMVGLTLSRINIQQAMYPEADFITSVVPLSKLPILSQAVLNKCDASDGIQDGILNEPQKCDFKPAVDLPRCSKNIDAPTCFTSKETDVLSKIYKETRAAKGTSYPGYSKGLEPAMTGFIIGTSPTGGGTSLAHPLGVPTVSIALAENTLDMYVPFFQRHVQPISLFDFELNNKLDVADLLTIAPVVSADNADLSPFKKKGGKLILYHGWSDQVLAPVSTVDYYKEVMAEMNGLKKTQKFARLFMVPGMNHCAGGPGPNTFDALSALENWVENGVAPEQIVATNTNGISRPLCPYPQIAKLNKGLDPTNPTITNNAVNFHCAKVDNEHDSDDDNHDGRRHNDDDHRHDHK